MDVVVGVEVDVDDDFLSCIHHGPSSGIRSVLLECIGMKQC